MDRTIFTNYTNNRITNNAHTPAYTHNHTYAIKYLSPNVEHLHFLCFGWDVCVWESECVFLTSGNKKTRKIAEPEFVQMFLIRPSQWWEGGQRASKNNRKKIIIFSFFFLASFWWWPAMHISYFTPTSTPSTHIQRHVILFAVADAEAAGVDCGVDPQYANKGTCAD